MKYRLESDDRADHLVALHGVDFYCGITMMLEQIRAKLKHGHGFMSADQALEWVRQELRDECGSALDAIEEAGE